jgi:hypothetical protein
MLGMTLIVSGIIIGITFGADFDRWANARGIGAAITISGLLTGIISCGIASIGVIKPKRVRADSITLTGLSSDFCETVEQYRILLEDDEEPA